MTVYLCKAVNGSVLIRSVTDSPKKTAFKKKTIP